MLSEFVVWLEYDLFIVGVVKALYLVRRVVGSNLRGKKKLQGVPV